MERDLLALRLSSESDQAIEATRALARMTWAYYETLKAQGFTSQQAMNMTMAMQLALIQGKRPEAF